MSIRNRIHKLEQANGPGLVVYIVDPFHGGEDEEPVICLAMIGEGEFERQPDEAQEAFMARVNPAGKLSVYLESDAHKL